jgi:membrane associated rhomboid family serine protease
MSQSISVPPPHLPEGVVAVALAPDRGLSREWSAVLLAKGVPHWTAEAGEGLAVFVPADQEALARAQLAAYDREQHQEAEAARRALPPPEMPGSPWPGLVLVAGMLAGIHWWRVTHGGALAGQWSRDGVQIFDHGEWWRPFTALLVHADLAHLLGNLSFGILLMWFVLQAYGRRLGWLWVALAGVAGNLAVAAVFYPEPFAGVGASTAVFAAVGLLVVHGMAWARSGAGLRGHRPWLVPLGGGLGLLGLFGSGGDDLSVDLGAHVAGFAAGLLVGAGPSWWQRWCRVRERPVTEAAIS